MKYKYYTSSYNKSAHNKIDVTAKYKKFIVVLFSR